MGGIDQHGRMAGVKEAADHPLGDLPHERLRAGLVALAVQGQADGVGANDGYALALVQPAGAAGFA